MMKEKNELKSTIKYTTIIFTLGFFTSVTLFKDKIYLASIPFSLAIIYTITHLSSKEEKWRSLKDSKTLFESSAFITTATIAIIMASAFFILQTATPELADSIYKITRTPIIIFGLSLPILALIANHHRSLQTSKQIELAQSHNNFTNYIKHKEMFLQTLRSTNIQQSTKFSTNPDELYSRIYNLAPEGDLSTSNSFNHLSEKLNKKTKILSNILKKDNENWNLKSNKTKYIINQITKDIEEGCLATINHYNINVTGNEDVDYALSANHWTNIIHAVQELLTALQKCSNFALTSPAGPSLRAAISNLQDCKFTLDAIRVERD